MEDDKFKIIFPTGYEGTDSLNDNIDINIILDNGKIYFATFFTINNINDLMRKENIGYFSADSMVIVESLEKENIYYSIKNIILNDDLNNLCSEIGHLKSFQDGKYLFTDLPVFSDFIELL